MTARDCHRPIHKRYFAYKDHLKLLNPDVEWEHLEVLFFIPMPKSWSQKKKNEMIGRPHRQRPDLDNLLKAFKDALLEEDSQVWRYKEIRKVWWDRGHIRYEEVKHDFS